MSRWRLVSYSLWQARDFAIDRGIAILLIGFLWGYAFILPVRSTMAYEITNRASPVWTFTLQISSAIVSVAVLIAVNGIVSIDRKTGYYRFLFAKPVNPILYYTQIFFVYMAGVMACMFVLSRILQTILPTFSIVNYMLYTALIYLAMGGIGFFLSVATRYDWLSLAAVWLGARILRTTFGDGNDWRSKAVQLLPPVHKLDEVSNSLIGTGTANSNDVLWLLGYGTLFLVLGLVLLRKGSLAD